MSHKIQLWDESNWQKFSLKFLTVLFNHVYCAVKLINSYLVVFGTFTDLIEHRVINPRGVNIPDTMVSFIDLFLSHVSSQTVNACTQILAQKT